MAKRNKSVYIFGSMLIGIVTVLAVLLILVGTGVIDTSSRDLVFTSASAEAVYDGTEFTDDSWELTSGELKSGHTAKVTVSGAQLNVGTSENHISVTIVDEQGADVSDGYNIKCIAGTLSVTPCYFEIKSGSAEKVYDGTPLTAENYTVAGGELPNGHDISVTYTGTITNVGVAQNNMTARIRDAKNRDVTANFKLTCTPGRLEVKKLAITFKSGDAEKEYDGTPLTAQTASVATGALCRGHNVKYEFTGTAVNAGTASNSFTAVITDGTGNDVTENYAVDYVFGTFSVGKRAVTVATDTDVKVYDGTPLIADSWRVVTDRDTGEWRASGAAQSLVGNDKIVVNVFGSVTDVGTDDNEFVIVSIKDGDGNDASLNYTVKEVTGTLTVTPRPLTVQSGEASKTYDGEPLTNNGDDGWSISSDTNLAPNHSITVIISGERTEVGESANTIAEVIITDAAGEDVTANYEIKYSEGALVVKGKSGTSFGNPPVSNRSVSLRLFSDYTEVVYLRNKSYGDYMGSVFMDAPVYDGGLDGKSCNYLASYSLKNSDVETRLLDIKLTTAPFVVPYYAMPYGEYVQTDDVTYTNFAREYTIERYVYNCKSDDCDSLKPLTEYTEEELAYRQFVYDNYLYVPDGTRAYMQRIIESQGFDKMDKRAVLKAVADYLQSESTAVYNLDYDRQLDREDDVVVAFLDKYREGICQHYAMSATMLFRTLGIPARYTIGYMGMVQAGEWTDITVGHAWSEAYVDGAGWVFVEATGGGADNGNPAEPDDPYDPEGGNGGELSSGDVFTVKPIECFKQYDGTPLTARARVQGLSKLLEHNYTFNVRVSGSQTEIGYGASVIDWLAIYDPDGNLVYENEGGAVKINTTEYRFVIMPGRLHVYKYRIAVRTGSAQKTYDGTPLTNNNYYFINDTALMDGHRFTRIDMGIQVDAGISVNAFDVTIEDGDGNDITGEYRIDVDYGTLEVLPIALTVSTHGASATQSELSGMGGALTCDLYDIIDADGNIIAEGVCGAYRLNGGFTINVEIVGSQNRRGRSDNIVGSVSIVDINGISAMRNFAITYVYGKLIVT
ncbi:MAG: transglutaminase domain-containing protein [Clostridiales bacterium]|nr:transglutaminase domain-containing protein [Clostridiales bacterium]